MPRTTSAPRRGAAPLVPLGSLTQPGARGAAGCLACGSDRVTHISMRLTDGTPVDFTSCHSCEHRSWTQQGEALAFTHVLDKTRKPA